jgi:methyl-accepting chemotaxis protein
MNQTSLRIFAAILLPIIGALTLIAIDSTNNVSASVMAALALVSIWYVANTGQQSQHWSELREALSRIQRGQSPKPVDEDAPLAVQKAWEQAERLHEHVQQLQVTVEEGAKRPTGLDEEATEKLKSVERELAGALAALADVAERQQAAGGTAQKCLEEMASALGGVAERTETLAGSAEEGGSAILQMTATNDQMAENIGDLGASVRESVASIEEMTFSIKEVAKNVDALSLTAEETSSSMNEMDVSIDQVQSNANETARLSEEVARDAETGAEAILKTIGEIYRIKESSQEAVSVISNLGSRIDAIGQILNVIDDVAEQTNLLALNAAIIAAQAGEHGKGFAVVADEIKDLAERAGASTKEIADLIKTIQSESRNAIQAVERGAQNVDRGVQVSNGAERALKKILESSQKSTNMVRAIARATVEQAKGSRQVTDSIGRIAETVQQIAAATAEQARGSELIMSSGEKMRAIAQQVERSSQEQSRGGRQITHAIEQITATVQQLNEGNRLRRSESEGARTALGDVVKTIDEQRESLESLGASLRSLERIVEQVSE